MNFVWRNRRYNLVRRIADLISSEASMELGHFGKQNWINEDFLRHVNKRLLDDFASTERKYMLYQLTKLLWDVAGETAECGVYRGASSYIIMSALGRYHSAFDSFEGVSEPTHNNEVKFWKRGDLTWLEENFTKNMGHFMNRCSVYKGWIPRRFPEVGEAKFCFVHIDVDLVSPTIESLIFFYTKMNKGGIILFDDYGFEQCLDAKNAIDNFFTDVGEYVIQLPTGQAFIIKI